MDGIGAHPYRQGLGFEPQSMAGGTGHQFQKLLQFLANRFTARIPELALQNRQNALKRPLVTSALLIAAIRLNHDRFPAAIEQHIPLLIG